MTISSQAPNILREGSTTIESITNEKNISEEASRVGNSVSEAHGIYNEIILLL